MTTEQKENIILAVTTLAFLFFTLIGSFVTTGNILDLLIILALICYLIQYAIIKIQDRKK